MAPCMTHHASMDEERVAEDDGDVALGEHCRCDGPARPERLTTRGNARIPVRNNEPCMSPCQHAEKRETWHIN